MANEFVMLEAHRSQGTHSISQLAKMGIVNRNSEQYKKKCAQASFLPFGIALEKGGRIELIAMNYDSLK